MCTFYTLCGNISTIFALSHNSKVDIGSFPHADWLKFTQKYFESGLNFFFAATQYTLIKLSIYFITPLPLLFFSTSKDLGMVTFIWVKAIKMILKIQLFRQVFDGNPPLISDTMVTLLDFTLIAFD